MRCLPVHAVKLPLHALNLNTNASGHVNETETITQLCFKYRLFVNFLSENLYKTSRKEVGTAGILD